jgi:FkbM family methyltransferase
MFKIPFKFILQKLLGIDNYLFLFSIFTINRLRLKFYNKEFLYFLKMIPEDGNVLDLGSNIGFMSVPLAKKASKGKVYSFEPIPGNTKILRRISTYYKLSNIEIFETALGDENGELTMVIPVIYNVKFHCFSHVVEKESDKVKGDLFAVRAQRLDDIPSLQGIPKINAVKIDVENYEHKVLKGAERLLKRHKPVLYCELWDNEQRILVINYLTGQLGYRVKVFQNNQLVDFTGQSVMNFFFV